MNKNSMFYWWPKVKDLSILQPKTSMVRFKGDFTFNVIDGVLNPSWERFFDKVKVEADKIGYPLFLRCDETSNKHDWKDSCYVESEDKLIPNFCRILEMIAMAFGIGFSGVAVREFLDLDARFTSHNGMPVACERRYFVRDGKVECWHPYWTPSAIRRPSIKNWYEVLKELQTPTSFEIRVLESYAYTVSETLGGYWSVDFCRHKNGSWYLTDMAKGEDSYHWGTCEFASPRMLEHYGDPEDLSVMKEYEELMIRVNKKLDVK